VSKMVENSAASDALLKDEGVDNKDMSENDISETQHNDKVDNDSATANQEDVNATEDEAVEEMSNQIDMIKEDKNQVNTELEVIEITEDDIQDGGEDENYKFIYSLVSHMVTLPDFSENPSESKSDMDCCVPDNAEADEILTPAEDVTDSAKTDSAPARIHVPEDMIEMQEEEETSEFATMVAHTVSVNQKQEAPSSTMVCHQISAMANSVPNEMLSVTVNDEIYQDEVAEGAELKDVSEIDDYANDGTTTKDTADINLQEIDSELGKDSINSSEELNSIEDSIAETSETKPEEASKDVELEEDLDSDIIESRLVIAVDCPNNITNIRSSGSSTSISVCGQEQEQNSNMATKKGDEDQILVNAQQEQVSLGYSESKFITSVDISSENECSGDEDNTRITAEVASEPHTSDDAIKMDDNQIEVPEPINTETGEVTDSEKYKRLKPQMARNQR